MYLERISVPFEKRLLGEICNETKTSRGNTMKSRENIIKEAYKTPYIVYFSELGDYDHLEYEYATETEAREKLRILIDEAKKNNTPYIAEIAKRITMETEE